MEMKASERGFTLAEILISVALIGILGAITAPLYQSFEQKNELDLAALNLAQVIRRAELLAQSVSGDSSWGIKVQTTTLTVFKGTTFTGRDANFDENTDFSEAISATGTLEIVFSKLYGLPQPTGTIIFSNTNQDSRSVTINAKGTAIY